MQCSTVLTRFDPNLRQLSGRQKRIPLPGRLNRIGSPVPVPSLQGHRRQNALRQVWPEDRQLAFERRKRLAAAP